MTVHCKKCNGKGFYSLRALRIHQWKAHPECYANTGKRVTALVKLEPVQEMSARALLAKVKNQATFMNDVVSLLEGIIK